MFPFVNVTSTVPAPAVVSVPMITTTVVALAYVHVAEVPVLGVAPTFAVHTNPSMKLVPVTVTVLLAYADKGAIEAAVGTALTVSVVPATVATLAPFVNVTSTDDAAAGAVSYTHLTLPTNREV